MQTIEGLRAGEYRDATKLKISCGLSEFPKEILDCHNLDMLDLSGNNLSDIPEEIKQLKNLKIGFFSDNKFKVFPKALGECPLLEMVSFKSNCMELIPDGENVLPRNLRWLILTNNQIKELPKCIGNCSRLQKIMLAGNRLQHLPSEMSKLLNLELIRISANSISHLPQWFLELPKLTWLAFAGNPCALSFVYDSALENVEWCDLEIGGLLGEGASGMIYKAYDKQKNNHVAVKLFKGEVTSDGLAEEEMNACISAGAHPHLISPLGKLCGQPQNKLGLLFELISSDYVNLGLPPNTNTCTRDVFRPNTLFSIPQIKSILKDIGSAVLHLHGHGIMHGDLYAHNVLVDCSGHSLLGDFGAATMYNKETHKNIEKLEVRAFGCLVDDLLNHNQDQDDAVVSKLGELRNMCTHPNVSCRPSFKEIVEQLGTM
ncbi:intracellular Ras-group-related LRR protein [Acrasis kona]|uniref:Intracellular Ras-group-related LRR protein n=1 Tax=Acrasis kona TaxID=1008807 RepID=A0AAW2Z722_9EUKA